MHIALVNITGGQLSGGPKKTMTALVPALLRVSELQRLSIFVHPQMLSIPGLCDAPMLAWPQLDALRGYAWLKERLRLLKPDAVLIPNARWLNVGPIPTVAMLRNMEAARQPLRNNPPGAAAKNILRSVLAKRACQKATRVIAVSEFARRFLIEHWSIPQHKVGLVYHGVETPIPRESVPPPTNLIHNAARTTWFTAGSILNYRGLEDAIRAVYLRKLQGKDDQLVIAGALVRGYERYSRNLSAMTQQLGVADRVWWLGQVSRQDLSSWLYNCRAFIMTSRIEACPNIVLEVLAHGCASISTSCAPMPEFYDTSALYYQAGDAGQLVDRMAQIDAMDHEAITSLQSAARKRGEEFSWSRAANATVEQCKIAIEGER